MRHNCFIHCANRQPQSPWPTDATLGTVSSSVLMPFFLTGRCLMPKWLQKGLQSAAAQRCSLPDPPYCQGRHKTTLWAQPDPWTTNGVIHINQGRGGKGLLLCSCISLAKWQDSPWPQRLCCLPLQECSKSESTLYFQSHLEILPYSHYLINPHQDFSK